MVGAGYLNFNGGTLEPSTSRTDLNSSFLNSGALTAMVVMDNGGTFNNMGQAVTIGTGFSHGGIAVIDGGMTFTGTGSVTLSASSTYNGGTTVNGGTLQLGNNQALGTGGLSVNVGELDLNGNSISLPSLSGGSGGLISDESTPAAFPPVPTMLTVAQGGTSTFGGTIRDGVNGQPLALTTSGTGTLILSGSNTYSGGTTVDAGTLIVNSSTALPDGTSLTVGAGGDFIFDPSVAGAPVAVSSGAAVTAVPEPGTLALPVAGAAAFAARRRKGLEVRSWGIATNP